MSVTVEVLNSNDTLADHEDAIRRAEGHGFTVLSITAGLESGRAATLVTFLQRVGTPASPVSLKAINGATPKLQQEAEINGLVRQGKTIVSYGTANVGGHLQNVVAFR